jgi:hypothetical protein
MTHNHLPARLYHLASSDHGSFINWHPRSFGINRPSFEPQTSRICFSLSVSGCLLSLGYIATQYKEWHLYSTMSSYYQPKTTDVVDSSVTEEVWRLSETAMNKIHIFSSQEKSELEKHLYFTSGNPSAIKYQLQSKIKIEKVLRKFIDAKT